MSKSSPFRLPYLLAGLLLILLIFALLDNPNRRESKQDTYKDQSLIQAFDETKVNKIELKKKEQTVILQNSDTGWTVASSNNYKANKTNVEELLQKIKAMKIDSLASKNKEKQDSLEVTNEKALHVIAYDKDNKALADFLIGKTGPSWPSQYVRKVESDEVLLVKENLAVTFDRPANDWRDKTIVSFDPQQISQLTVYYKHDDRPDLMTRAPFKKENNQWFMIDTFTTPTGTNVTTDQEKVQALLAKISTLTTLDFLDNAKLEDYGLAPGLTNDDYDEISDTEKIKISLRKSDNSLITIHFSQKDKEPDYYYIRVDKNPTLFKITKNQAEEFKIKPEEYKKTMSEAGSGETAVMSGNAGNNLSEIK